MHLWSSVSKAAVCEHGRGGINRGLVWSTRVVVAFLWLIQKQLTLDCHVMCGATMGVLVGRL